MSKEIIIQTIEPKIHLLRGHKIIIDRDMATLYGVTTKALNQAVQRNKARFPSEFMFQLTQDERDKVVTNCDHLRSLKFSRFLPFAFTEHGVLMLANVLRSTRACEMSVKIIQVFVRMRNMLMAHQDLAIKLKALEQRVGEHDDEIQGIIRALQQLLIQEEKPKRRMGFHPD